MMDSFDPANAHVTTTNGSAATVAESTQSIEAVLFSSGAISADQLGELVRDSVLTQRPVAAIALERGLASREMLTALHAQAGIDVSLPELLGDGGSFREVVAPVAEAAVAVQPVPVPEPQQAAPEPVQTVELPRVAALGSLDERVQAAVAQAAPAPLPMPSLEEVPRPLQAAPAPPETNVVRAASAFAVLVRLQTGDRIAAETAETFESAVEVARTIAGRFATAGEWPLIGGRCVRPDAVVSIDIERALES